MSANENAPNLLVLASKAVKNMSLQDISLVEADVKRHQRLPSQFEGELELDTAFMVNYTTHEEGKFLESVVRFRAIGLINIEGSQKKLFKVVVGFSILYSIDNTDPELTHESIDAFAKLNSVYNAWPYWRSYLQDYTTRMGLPAATIQLITAQEIVATLQKHEEEHAAAQSQLADKTFDE